MAKKIELRLPSDLRKVPKSKRRAAYLRFLKKNQWVQDSLDTRISADVELSAAEISNLLDIFGYRAHQGTKWRLRDVLRRVPNIRSYGIYRRVLVTDRGRPGTAMYVAGQDYAAEVPFVRRLLAQS